jgi:hypothetical protein
VCILVSSTRIIEEYMIWKEDTGVEYKLVHIGLEQVDFLLHANLENMEDEVVFICHLGFSLVKVTS